MRLLDLFCGAGGAAEGYWRAGFTEIVGVDIRAQPRYPFDLVQADALNSGLDLSQFDLIHASPPCQAYSIMRRGRWQDRKHPDLIKPTRDLLSDSNIPYVIENVSGSRDQLINPIMLCGSMFGLQTKDGAQLRRHRYFECSSFFGLTPTCQHNRGSVIGVYGGGQHPQRRKPATIGVYGNSGGSSKRDYLDYSCFTVDARREAMGIQWMVGKELSEAIPPAYTEWIGRRVINDDD